MIVKALALTAGLLGMASVAQAIPVAPLDSPSAVIDAASGCGRGWHYTRAHGCLPPRVPHRQYVYKPSYRYWHHMKKPY